MQIDLAALLLILLAGIVAFVCGTVYVVFRVLAHVVDSIATWVRPRTVARVGAGVVAGGGLKTCPRHLCCKAESRQAFYCSRCGARLSAADEREH